MSLECPRAIEAFGITQRLQSTDHWMHIHVILGIATPCIGVEDEDKPKGIRHCSRAQCRGMRQAGTIFLVLLNSIKRTTNLPYSTECDICQDGV